VADEPPRTPSAEELAASLASRVRDTLATAERAAAQIRAAADAEAEARAREVRDAAARDAERLLLRAEREAQDYLEDSRRRVDAFAAGRARRISAVADRLLAHAEALAARSQRAGRLHRGIDQVVEALAAAAEAVAAEAERPPIRLPGALEPVADVTRLTTRPHAVPDPEPEHRPAAPGDPDATPADDAREHVRQIASALPRRPGTGRRVTPVPPPESPPEPPADPPPAPDAA
jgi:chromosome segregation protein